MDQAVVVLGINLYRMHITPFLHSENINILMNEIALPCYLEVLENLVMIISDQSRLDDSYTGMFDFGWGVAKYFEEHLVDH